MASPRLFKSHEPWEHIAKGGRYIYVARDPLDAFVSFHKFLPAYTGLQPGDISHEQFAAAIVEQHIVRHHDRGAATEAECADAMFDEGKLVG